LAIPGATWGAALAIEARTTRVLETPSGDFTMHGQYAQAAVLAFALVLLALLGSVEQLGRGLVVALVATCVAVWAVAGILFPDDATSPGGAWGTIALVGVVAYVTCAAVSARRRPRAGDASPQDACVVR
jgi:hypothetical protein